MLYSKTFVFSPFMENTYVVYTDNGDAAVIDPGCYEQDEKEKLKEFIDRKNLIVRLLLNTHSHLDHVFGNAFVSRTWNVTPRVHVLDEPVYSRFDQMAAVYGIPGTETPPEPDYCLQDQSEINLGNEKLRVIHLPGHCPGHVAFIHDESKKIYSGDVLFQRSIGRTDLPGGEHDTLIMTIKQVLFKLPDDYEVFPGHGIPTTIGEEKKHNPFLN